MADVMEVRPEDRCPWEGILVLLGCPSAGVVTGEFFTTAATDDLPIATDDPREVLRFGRLSRKDFADQAGNCGIGWQGRRKSRR